MVQNPFSNRNMITNPDDFFRREKELKKIFGGLQNLQSFDVYGERKIGKSSLLYHVFQTAQNQLAKDYVVVYIDMQAAENLTVESFLRNCLNKLGADSKRVVPSNSINQNLIAFSESIKRLRTKKKPVLLIDEFEILVRKKEFINDIFDALRSLGTNGYIAYVTASMNSLKTLCERGNFTSPFYNIFSEVHLGKFTPEETEGILSEIGERFGFNDEQLRFIYEIADHHPLHLQIACFHVFENKRSEWDEKRLREDIATEIRTYDYKGVIIESNNRPVEANKKNEQIKEEDIIKLITDPATIAGFIGLILLELYTIYITKSIEHSVIVFIVVLIFYCLYFRNKRKTRDN